MEREDRKSQELEVIIPDPTVLLAALDQITEKVVNKDARRKFRIDTARKSLKVDILTTFESVENLATIIESEIEDMVTMSWSVVTPKVKSINGTPKGKNGKDGKGSDSKGKKRKGEKGKGKTESCFFFTESEEGCKNGQQRTRYHRMLKPEKKNDATFEAV